MDDNPAPRHLDSPCRGFRGQQPAPRELPCEAHERLATLEGSWTQSLNMWTQRGQDAARATGACENEMILVSENEYVTEVIFKDEAHTGGEGPFRVVEVIARRVVQ